MKCIDDSLDKSFNKLIICEYLIGRNEFYCKVHNKEIYNPKYVGCKIYITRKSTNNLRDELRGEE